MAPSAKGFCGAQAEKPVTRVRPAVGASRRVGTVVGRLRTLRISLVERSEEALRQLFSVAARFAAVVCFAGYDVT